MPARLARLNGPACPFPFRLISCIAAHKSDRAAGPPLSRSRHVRP
jgi:hypothetical protein